MHLASRAIALATAAALLGACGRGSDTGGQAISGAAAAAGPPVEMPARPDPEACAGIVRAATAVAAGARGMLGTLDTSQAAVAAAAADPGADTRTYGIPLTRRERDALRAAGVEPDPIAPFGSWMSEHPDVLSSVIFDGELMTVGVKRADDAVLAEAQCWEIAAVKGKVAYRFTRLEDPDLAGLAARVEADRAAMLDAGIRVTEIRLDRARGVVVIELDPLDEAAADRLIARYGGDVEIRSDNGFAGR